MFRMFNMMCWNRFGTEIQPTLWIGTFRSSKSENKFVNLLHNFCHKRALVTIFKDFLCHKRHVHTFSDGFWELFLSLKVSFAYFCRFLSYVDGNNFGSEFIICKAIPSSMMPKNRCILFLISHFLPCLYLYIFMWWIELLKFKGWGRN